jgi:hypothetical protein
MKLKNLLLSFALISSVSNVSIAQPIYYLDGKDQDIGDVSISGGRPVSSKGYQFVYFKEFEDENGKKTAGDIIVLNNVKTGSVNVPNWDIWTAGNCTFGGNATAKNINIGVPKGQLKN